MEKEYLLSGKKLRSFNDKLKKNYMTVYIIDNIISFVT